MLLGRASFPFARTWSNHWRLAVAVGTFPVWLPFNQALAQVRELQIAPAQIELQPGEQKSILVTAYDGGGNVIPGVEFRWTVDETVAKVTRDGTAANILYVQGVGPGTTSVRVTAGTVSGVADVRVLAGGAPVGVTGVGQATLLRVEPATVYLLPTEEVQLRPFLLKEDGSAAGWTAISWRSLLETVATVDSRGMVVGIAPGQGVVEGQTPTGVTGRAMVVVENVALGFARRRLSLTPLESDTVSVVLPSQGGRRLSNHQVRWSSSNPMVINVSPVGVVTAIRVGEAEVIIQGFGQQHALPVSVHAPVARLDVTPQPGRVTVPLGGSVPFEARMLTADGSVVPEASASWVVADTAVARFDPAARRVRGVGSGTTSLTVQGPKPNISAEWQLDVVAGKLSIEPRRVALARGEQAALRAAYLSTSGERLADADELRWSALDGSVVRVGSDGAVEAIGWGSTRVVAASTWGATDSVDAYVLGELLVTSTRGGSADVYALDLASPEDLYRVTNRPGAEVSAAYSPSGTKIAFIATDQGNADIYVMWADGSGVERLTATEADEAAPQWTPGGEQIVYARMEGRTTQVWIMNADGSDQRMLTTGAGSSDQPAVSPDGKMVAFRSMDGRQRHIHIMNLDGTERRPFTSGDGAHKSPRWFPDGALGYVVERREDRRQVSSVVKVVISTGAEERLTSPDLSVIEFDVSRTGAALAVIAQARENDVVTQRLYVIRVGPGGAATPVLVPPMSAQEQFLGPSFRR